MAGNSNTDVLTIAFITTHARFCCIFAAGKIKQTNTMEKKQTMTYKSPVVKDVTLENSSVLCDSVSTTYYEEDSEYNPNIWG